MGFLWAQNWVRKYLGVGIFRGSPKIVVLLFLGIDLDFFWTQTAPYFWVAKVWGRGQNIIEGNLQWANLVGPLRANEFY
jgi:hypothetical protein